MKKIILFALLSFIYSSGSFGQKLPVEAFSQLPDVSNLVLSPDGTRVASAVRIDLPDRKGTAVQTINLKTKESKFLMFFENTSFILNGISWKDNKTLLVYSFAATKQKNWGYWQRNYDKVRITRLAFVNTQNGQITTPFTSMFLSQFDEAPEDLDTVIDSLPNDPNHVLMAVYGRVYKVNIHKGSTDLIPNQPKTFYANVTDTNHRLRAGYHYDDGGKVTVKYFDLEQEKWFDLAKYQGGFSSDEITVLGFSHDPNELFLNAYHNDRWAVFKVNLKDNNLKRELVLADDKYDVSGYLVYSEDQKKIIGVSGREDGGTHFFDKELNQLQEKINKAMPQTANYIYSFSEDLNQFIVFSISAKESGTYYLGQRSPLKLNAIAYRYKNLPPNMLADVKRIEYKARDGLVIEAFLTLPKNKPEKNLPTLMFPHGGPHARDNSNFDYWAQFFANKGYAVLQMNFRGSYGQGLTHMTAGLKQWGKEMQTDIEDGARYLIAKGIADPNAVAIVGASYGGYAALMGTVRTPDLYRCAISFAGVSDVYKKVVNTRDGTDSYNVVDEQIGTGAKFLKDISPINHAEAIKKPILLIHGENDRQVEIEHSEKMHKALLKAGKDVEFLTLPLEDHYLTNESNRIATFKAMDKFLDKCIPAH
ncbi:MAG TPA: S9 family peptidase [Cellvibrio sp.]|nr:S9 family peptidase [Cellvibrio sp.]